MEDEARNVFFEMHYEEIMGICRRVANRVSRFYGWHLKEDILGYAMEGMVRGLNRLRDIPGWQSFLFAYSYHRAVSGIMEFLGYKRHRTAKPQKDVEIAFYPPCKIERLSNRGTQIHVLDESADRIDRLEKVQFFRRLRPSLERDVLRELMDSQPRKTVLHRFKISARQYYRTTATLKTMYALTCTNQPIDHMYTSRDSM